MKKKKWIYLVTAIVIIALVYMLFLNNSEKTTEYTFDKITKGNLDIVITSSGTLEAISTVEVGTQVSGKIAKIYADFNDEVKKGQLLAVLDTTSLASQVKDAKANYFKAKADYNQKTAIHEVNKKLYEKSFISELDFVKSQTDVESSLASLNSAEAALERANTNLGYAYIYSPIAGKIINRAVEQGQTVAASLSSPTLFAIAEDLSSMRILASVDESDIGQIKEGQKVKYTVQTYTDKTFEGTVTQIRLQAKSVSNVVNYIVVISAENKDQLLLPGMTATVDFYIDHREDVLLVPNAALRVDPGEEMLKELQKNMEEEMQNLPDSIKNARRMGPPPSLDGSLARPDMTKMKKVLYLDDRGKLKMYPVIVGMTDGKNTEVNGRELKDGMKIIVSIQDEEISTTKKSSSITPTQQQTGGPPAPPMM